MILSVHFRFQENCEQKGEGSLLLWDKMSLLSIGMIVRPTLCNYTAKHPKQLVGTKL